MAEKTITLTLVLMAVVTFIPRLLPAWFLRDKSLPPFMVAWLRYVPVAVLAAMLLPALIVKDNSLNLQWNNIYLWAAFPAGWVAWKKKSLFGTVITGMAVVALARLLVL
jgi:branched-subunit amino acid transport protein